MRTVFSKFTKTSAGCAIETTFMTFTLALACFSTLAVNEFIIHARFVQKGFPYRIAVFFHSPTLQELGLLWVPLHKGCLRWDSALQTTRLPREKVLCCRIDPTKFICHIKASHTFQSLPMHSQTLYMKHPLVTTMPR